MSDKIAVKLTIEQAEQLAKDHLSIETLETQNSDGLDFHDVSVWSIRDLIFAVYEAGHEAGKKG